MEKVYPVLRKWLLSDKDVSDYSQSFWSFQGNLLSVIKVGFSPPASTAPEQLRINCWNTAAGFMSSLCQFLVHHFLIFASVQGFWWIFLWHQRSSHFCHHDRTIWQQSKIGFCSGHLLSSDTRESLIFPALIWPRRLIYLYWLSWPLPLLYSLHYDVHPW